jgi:hypothetical protein
MVVALSRHGGRVLSCVTMTCAPVFRVLPLPLGRGVRAGMCFSGDNWENGGGVWSVEWDGLVVF